MLPKTTPASENLPGGTGLGVGVGPGDGGGLGDGAGGVGLGDGAEQKNVLRCFQSQIVIDHNSIITKKMFNGAFKAKL
jgi:hypothetical protein